jgi:hypothetical protein
MVTVPFGAAPESVGAVVVSVAPVVAGAALLAGASVVAAPPVVAVLAPVVAVDAALVVVASDTFLSLLHAAETRVKPRASAATVLRLVLITLIAS